MAEVKEVPISKKLLTQLPPPVDEKPEVKPDPRDEVIEKLTQRLEAVEAQIAFIASFEAKLLKAFNDEIAILEEGSKLTKNEMQRSAFVSIANALERVRDRWANDFSFHIDRKKLSFVRKKVSDE
jgi:hypothetical protein